MISVKHVLLLICFLLSIASCSNNIFPIEDIDIFDSFIGTSERTNILREKYTNYYCVMRVENKSETLTLSDIKMRIDFFNDSGKLIDGEIIEVRTTVPPISTRRVQKLLDISGLPKEYKWTYKIIEARQPLP